jgi:oxazoline/thiazoline dehydrogenase
VRDIADLLAVSLSGPDVLATGTSGTDPAAQDRPELQAVAGLLQQRAVSFAELNELHQHSLPSLYAVLQDLWGQRRIKISDRPTEPHLSVTPTIPGSTLELGFGDLAAGQWKLSRFAFLRASESGELQIETPRYPILATVHTPHAGAVFAALSRPASLAELAVLPSAQSDDIERMLRVLLLARAIEPVQPDGRTAEENDNTLRQWEFHDMLFHAHSRMGRHSEPMGAQFRFRSQIDAQPVVKTNPWRAKAIPLTRANLTAVAARDLPFTTVLEARRSNRDQDASRPMTLPQLGEFLYRTARIRSRFNTEIGEFSSRPYPSGGAAYELELYVTVDACVGLMRGFYYYDPSEHALCAVRPPNDEMEGLITDAWTSAAQLCRPQILITAASRFQRVSWKYSGIAYATQLKNVGVLYQTFYLVATAMGLAGCALGLGNSERLRRLTGTDFFEESSIGEFMLGSSGMS